MTPVVETARCSNGPLSPHASRNDSIALTTVSRRASGRCWSSRELRASRIVPPKVAATRSIESTRMSVPMTIPTSSPNDHTEAGRPRPPPSEVPRTTHPDDSRSLRIEMTVGRDNPVLSTRSAALMASPARSSSRMSSALSLRRSCSATVTTPSPRPRSPRVHALTILVKAYFKTRFQYLLEREWTTAASWSRGLSELVITMSCGGPLQRRTTQCHAVIALH